MKKSKHSNVSSILRSFSLSLSLSISAGCIQAETIFSEDFTGTSEDLDGSAPDIRPGTETWIAGPVFNQDGSLDPDHPAHEGVDQDEESELRPVFLQSQPDGRRALWGG